MDMERIELQPDVQAQIIRVGRASRALDQAVADAAERLTCADLLERLGRPAHDHTPDGVMDAIDAAMRAAAARTLCEEFGLTPTESLVRALKQLRERFEGYAQAVAAAHEQRDRANKRAEDAEAKLAARCEDVEAAERRAEDAEEKIERMRGSAEPAAWAVVRKCDRYPIGVYLLEASAGVPDARCDVVPLYAHPPAAPTQPAGTFDTVAAEVEAGANVSGLYYKGTVLVRVPDTMSWADLAKWRNLVLAPRLAPGARAVFLHIHVPAKPAAPTKPEPESFEISVGGVKLSGTVVAIED